MLKLIVRHSVPEFFELITGPIDENNMLGRLMVNFVERTLVLRLVENTKELRHDFSYSLLELDTAEEFMRLEHEISSEESYEQWEGFAKESYIKRGQYSQNSKNKKEYFEEWTEELKLLTVALLTGELSPEDILPEEPLRYWNSFHLQLSNFKGNVAETV